MARPLNFTTKIAAAQTVGECTAVLAQAGASSVATHFEDGRPRGLSFAMQTPHGKRNFTLPVDVAAMHKVLLKAKADGQFASIHARADAFTTLAHAENVAWRVVKDWLEANLALIAAQMASLDMIMLPFLHVDAEHTLYQAYREREETAALLPGSTR